MAQQSALSSPPARPSPASGWTGSIDDLLADNRRWATDLSAADPSFFPSLSTCQAPRYLWIGCSDSRVPANQILNLPPGAIFVHRNVGNLATHKDLNAMACLEYAVAALKVEHVIVCGHHGCGAVAAALSSDGAAPSLVNLWIADVRDTRNLNLETLASLEGGREKVDRLVELNVARQTFNVCTAPCVQAAWAAGRKLAVHGLVYSLDDGLLREVAAPITGPRGLAAHVDDPADPGWPHATTVRRSSRGVGGSGPAAVAAAAAATPGGASPTSPGGRLGRGVLPGQTDCSATTKAAIESKMAAVAQFASGAERERQAEAEAEAEGRASGKRAREASGGQ